MLLPTSKPPPDQLLGIYLNDHLTGASVGVELARRSAKGQLGAHRRTELSRLAEEVEEDRGSLVRLMKSLGVPVQKHRIAAGWAVEKLGRLKPNGTWVHRSPLSDVIELESLRLGVEGKLCLWRLLRQLADKDTRISVVDLDDLEQRAAAQIETLETMRLEAGEALGA